MTCFSCALPRRISSLAWRVVPAAAVLFGTACSGMNDALTSHTGVVASAAGKELRVEEAAEMLATNPQVPADPQVVRALADLWVDYALLSMAVAEDSTLAALDMEGFIKPVREQALVMRLREQVVQVDTTFDDAEVTRRWASEGPGAEIRARHILLRVPAEGSDAQRDSVVQLAESLRTRAAGGESFAALAQQYSQDGSASQGGDLGFFSRGRMVEPFENVAFSLEPGEVGPVVETPFGYHIILVEERRQQELGGDREQFRQFLVQQAVEQAELKYLDSLSAGVNVEIPTEGFTVVRDIAGRPDRDLSGRQADREIATYEGGEFTAGEFIEFVRNQPAEMQTAFASATDDQLQTAVEQLVQMELLLAEVERRKIALPAEEEERLRTEARQMITELVNATGFAAAARGGADEAARDAQVKEIVRGVVSGQAPFVPLGRLGISLREVYDYEINDEAFAEVITSLEEIRASQPPQPQQPGMVGPGGMPIDPSQMPQGIDPSQMQMPATPPPAPGGAAVPAPQTPGQ